MNQNLRCSLLIALLGVTLSCHDATAAITVHPEPGANCGVGAGHRAVFRKASASFGAINTVDEAIILFNYSLPNPNVEFEEEVSGSASINFTDTFTNPRPQQHFGSDRDVHSVAPLLFGAGDLDNYAARLSSYIHVPTAGIWTFTVNSDEGFRLRMGAEQYSVLDSPNPKTPS